MAFDVFGTVVDWRSGVAREARAFLADIGHGDIDPHGFADRWRALYQPAMEDCRSGRRPYTRLDILNRETLEILLDREGIDPRSIDEDRLHHFAFAWRRLDPWPDALAGLVRLKARFPIVTLSNGNTALTLAMARRAGLPWDAILGAESTGLYKPLPGSYLGTADILGIAPQELCLVAAHHSDLAAARAVGLMAAYVDRPREYGGAPAPDAHYAQTWDHSVESLTELADRI
ncbi:haloacid dehalogenase [Sphingomonas sp. Leaf357]|uniref:haloacid dehalogenase type II n=1 Tax=Sphingomonas sp. Leaf357 TaxID=1736350 RepID=UPI000700E944|nr:haloacid dehalogenase type II [Sphingomonas sp. Leaf357]KQS04215.1 haloacid dehalogenase [Sphingomonas sp. Leaf357]